MSSYRFVTEAAEHVDATTRAVGALLDDIDRIERWGRRLAHVLANGGRLLVAGNGGSAAHAQHLTSELVGRYREERMPLSAIALHGETSTVTAVLNDYGAEEVFARQVRAHGRPGDVFIALSTSGRSPNLLRAAEAAHAHGLHVWAITGPSPCVLATLADDALCIAAPSTAVIQEVHQVAVHLLCEALESSLPSQPTAFQAAFGA
ncbi:MAG TPA: SIS domain-containing protein [Acidimicrobiia bacterium]|nr:SIS domain-containing protein [Acidimicrobiia bacterium]